MNEEEKLPQEADEEYSPDNGGRMKWAGFIETHVVDFFDGNKLEKMSVEDGNGNKAKLSRTKDNGIKLEYSSTVVL